MGALNGTLTYSTWYIDGTMPSRQQVLELLVARSFRGLDVSDDHSAGWVVMGSPLDTEFTYENAFIGTRLCFSLRYDKWALPSALVKARVAEKTKAHCAEHDRKKLTREEKQEIKELVEFELRQKATPSMKAVDVVWDTATNTIRFWSHSGRLTAAFAQLFVETFSLEAVAKTPATWAMALEFSEEQIAAVTQNEIDPEAMAKAGAVAGEEFLTWMLFHSEQDVHFLESDDSGQELWVSNEIKFSKEGGQKADSTVLKGQTPSESPEAMAALAEGKLVTRATFGLVDSAIQMGFKLDGPTLRLSSVGVPTVIAKDPEERLCERMLYLDRLEELLGSLWARFLATRSDCGEWQNYQDDFAAWAGSDNELSSAIRAATEKAEKKQTLNGREISLAEDLLDTVVSRSELVPKGRDELAERAAETLKLGSVDLKPLLRSIWDAPGHKTALAAVSGGEDIGVLLYLLARITGPDVVRYSPRQSLVELRQSPKSIYQMLTASGIQFGSVSHELLSDESGAQT